MFSTLPKANFNFSVTFILSSSRAFSLDQCKNLSFGKELRVNSLPNDNLFNSSKFKVIHAVLFDCEDLKNGYLEFAVWYEFDTTVWIIAYIMYNFRYLLKPDNKILDLSKLIVIGYTKDKLNLNPVMVLLGKN